MTQITFDPTLTVNDAVARHPRTVAIFNEFGIDACCGGAATIEEAARRDGADPDALAEAVRRVIEGDAR
jgi:iron-sulfur cluster repair protein YtfE (RIC family)